MKYTDEQLKALAEWLGWSVKLEGLFRSTDDYFLHSGIHWFLPAFIRPNLLEGDAISGYEFNIWLLSPEGQSAVMDRLIKAEIQPGFSVGDLPRTNIPGVRVVLSRWNATAVCGEYCFSWQEALIAAVLAMLGKEVK